MILLCHLSTLATSLLITLVANDTAESSSNLALSEQFSDPSMAVAFGFVRSFFLSFVASLVGLIVGWLVHSFVRS